jgi:hypothetical protein
VPFPRARAIERVSSREALSPGHPVVISEALGGPRALGAWTLARLRAEHGNAEVFVRESDADAPQLFAGDPQRAFRFLRMPLAEVIDGFSCSEAPRRYVQMCDLARTLPHLAADIRAPGAVGKLYASPAYAWICAGGTVNPLHFDFNEILLAQVVGKKRLLLFPPEDSSKIAGLVERAIFRTTSLDFLRPDGARFPGLDRTTPYEAVIGPGEALFIPYRWWHAMVAPEPSVSVSWWWEPSRSAHIRHTVRQRSADLMKILLRAVRVT